MKKNEQIAVNTYIENVVNYINVLLGDGYPSAWYRLNSCKAEWGRVGKWMVLRSYSTVVAAYYTETDELFDFLRLVYGYSATSAQHIAKFHRFCRSVTVKNLATRYGGDMYRWYAV